MVGTRGKKTGRLKKSVENKAAENASSVKQTSDSVILEDGITVAKDRNNEYGTEETEKVTDADHEDENTTEVATNGEAESEENTSDDEDEVDDHEDEMWADDDEDSKENAKSLVDKDTIGKDEAIEETSEEEAIEEDSEEVEYSEASMEEDDEEQENTLKDELTKVKDTEAKPVGKDTEANVVGNDNEEQDVQKLKISSTKMEKSIESSGKLKMEKSSESNGKLKKMEKASESSGKSKMEKSSEGSGKKVLGQLPKKVGAGDRPESSTKQKAKKRVESMGMIFMCSAMTKDECYQYKVLGLPESKKDIVEKIYTGMRLFLYDVDLKLLYGIYKAAGPGGFNLEPKAFKSQFPSQVRFTILDDCLPLAEEKFKKVIKENYFTSSKFDCQLNSEQVRKLCRMFLGKRKGKRSNKFVRQLKSGKRQPARREGPGKQRAGIKRPQASKEDLLLHAYPRKRPRKVTSSAVTLRRSPPRKVTSSAVLLRRSPRASLSPSLRLYAYGRTTDADAYRRDSYLESHSHHRERRGPIISRRDPYRDWRDSPPTELDRNRDGRDINLVYHGKDKHDPYIGRRDHHRDAGDPYPERRDHPYRDGRDSYIARHNTYRDDRDAYLKIRDSDRDKRDSYLDRRGSYIDRTYLAPYSNDRRDPLANRDTVRREVPGLDYRNSYRPEELPDLRLGLEPRRHHDIGSRDSYATYQRPSAYAEPVYSSEYPPRLATAARQYHI